MGATPPEHVYSSNKWHQRDDTCLLCLQPVADRFHLLLACPLTVSPEHVYSSNKWHQRDDTCPLCLQPVADRFHLLLACPLTVSLWSQLTPSFDLLAPSRCRSRIWPLASRVRPRPLPSGISLPMNCGLAFISRKPWPFTTSGDWVTHLTLSGSITPASGGRPYRPTCYTSLQNTTW